MKMRVWIRECIVLWLLITFQYLVAMELPQAQVELNEERAESPERVNYEPMWLKTTHLFVDFVAGDDGVLFLQKLLFDEGFYKAARTSLGVSGIDDSSARFFKFMSKNPLIFKQPAAQQLLLCASVDYFSRWNEPDLCAFCEVLLILKETKPWMVQAGIANCATKQVIDFVKNFSGMYQNAGFAGELEQCGISRG